MIDYEGYYQVSDRGQVRSLPRTTVSSRGSSYRVAGGLLTLGLERRGHVTVALTKDGVTRHPKVAHLVLRAFVGPPEPGQKCLHWNGDQSDNHVRNLRWGTQADNMRDLVRNGNHHMTKRERCPQGHPLVVPNLRDTEHRMCKACHRASAKISYEVKMGRPAPDLQKLSDLKYVEIMKEVA